MSNDNVSPVDVELADFSIFEGLFTKGYTTSPPIKVLNSPEENLDLIVVYRTLEPTELRDIFEEVSKYKSNVGQTVTEQLETLARAIVTINGMPLSMSKPEVDQFHAAHNRYPSPLDAARFVVKNKIKSIPVVDALYNSYIEYAESVIKKFEELKKKSETQG